MIKFLLKLFILIVLTLILNSGVDMILPMAKADMAVLQLQNSDSAYVAFSAVNNMNPYSIKTIGFGLLVLIIYFTDIRKIFKKTKKQGDK